MRFIKRKVMKIFFLTNNFLIKILTYKRIQSYLTFCETETKNVKIFYSSFFFSEPICFFVVKLEEIVFNSFFQRS